MADNVMAVGKTFVVKRRCRLARTSLDEGALLCMLEPRPRKGEGKVGKGPSYEEVLELRLCMTIVAERQDAVVWNRAVCVLSFL